MTLHWKLCVCTVHLTGAPGEIETVQLDSQHSRWCLASSHHQDHQTKKILKEIKTPSPLKPSSQEKGNVRNAEEFEIANTRTEQEYHMRLCNV